MSSEATAFLLFFLEIILLYATDSWFAFDFHDIYLFVWKRENNYVFRAFNHTLSLAYLIFILWFVLMEAAHSYFSEDDNTEFALLYKGNTSMNFFCAKQNYISR